MLFLTLPTKQEKGLDTGWLIFPYCRKQLLEVSDAAQCYTQRQTWSPLTVTQSLGLGFQFSVSQQDPLATSRRVTLTAFWEIIGTGSSDDKLAVKCHVVYKRRQNPLFGLNQSDACSWPWIRMWRFRKMFLEAHSCSLAKCSVAGQWETAG